MASDDTIIDILRDVHDDSANAVRVEGPITIVPSGTQDVNITEYGGTASTLGQKASTASIPVVIASDQSSINVTADTELPAAAALGDAIANPTTPTVGSFISGWDATGAHWDRVRTSGNDSDGIGTGANGNVQTMAHLQGFNGTNWDRLRSSLTAGLQVDPTSKLVHGVTFDTIQVTAVNANNDPTTILYKTGGLAGSTVATLTIAYDGSGDFQSVVKT